MEHDRPRWRIRISTLMLLVIIAALSFALVVERWKKHQNEQRLSASLERAQAQARRAYADALQAQAGAQRAKASSTRSPGAKAPREDPQGRTTVDEGR